MARSDSTTAGASGRQTLTTTRCPERSVAAWTWAMDAAANGVRSNAANSSSTPAPSSALITSSISDHGTGSHIVLEPTQFLDELIGQQVTAGGEHLPEFDEGDAAVLESKANRAGQTGATIGGAEL